jgi:hypothetical protein
MTPNYVELDERRRTLGQVEPETPNGGEQVTHNEDPA